jgi:hypothetical protein
MTDALPQTLLLRAANAAAGQLDHLEAAHGADKRPVDTQVAKLVYQNRGPAARIPDPLQDESGFAGAQKTAHQEGAGNG